MTNVNGCKHIGQKSDKDWSICIRTFRNINHFDWLNIINKEEDKIEINLVDKDAQKNIYFRIKQIFFEPRARFKTFFKMF